jgi:hypothetical protein
MKSIVAILKLCGVLAVLAVAASDLLGLLEHLSGFFRATGGILSRPGADTRAVLELSAGRTPVSHNQRGSATLRNIRVSAPASKAKNGPAKNIDERPEQRLLLYEAIQPPDGSVNLRSSPGCSA